MTIRFARLLLPVTLALFALGAVGCDDHDHGKTEDHFGEAIEHTCVHLKDGPAKAHTLTKDATGAPDMTVEHHRLDLTFVDTGSGDMGGVGTWKSAEAADYVLMLSDDVTVKVTDSAGKEVEVEESKAKPTECAEAAVAHKMELAVGTYTLTFGPSKASGVKAVIGEVGGEHGH